ncbi:MAG: DUF5067 domain-containing protein [Clostridium sp.]|nr:DUF5067 domain-containing protein [Clostridium sp.]
MEDNNYQQNEQQQYYQQPYQPMNNMPPQEKKANVGLAILSFLIPLAGLIIFLTQKDKKPKTAKASGICALVSFILYIVFCIIMTVAGGFLVGSAVDEALSDDSFLDSALSDSVQGEGNIIPGDVIGDYKCVVTGAKICKDWEGKDAVLITYDFTNNSDEATSFDVALEANAYQDGIGLETAILEDEDTDYLDVNIKPGVTKAVNKAYLLRDTSTAVEIEINEWLSLNDDKIATTVELTK